MKEIIYQLALRNFTPEGTLCAAKERLQYVADLGISVIYLCPCFREDDDPDMATWSPRQRASGTMNPKNPYKIIDYFSVDNEFGSDSDLVDFIAEAHRLGMRVLLDLVYLHCGKNAPFIKEHPDFVRRNPDGSILVGETWPFARLNFDCPELWDYLISNMKHLIEYYNCDGFRCDCGNMVPVEFWEKSFEMMRRLKENLIFLNEGNLSDGRGNIFDIAYNWDWRSILLTVIGNNESAELIKEHISQKAEYFSKAISYLDQHDTASDSGLARNELLMTSKGMDTAYVLTFTLSPLPLIWNGTEISDNFENNMFANRLHTRRSEINWSRILTKDGQRRLALIKALTKLHKEHSAFGTAIPQWVDNSEKGNVISYIMTDGNEKLLVAANLRNKELCAEFEASVDGKPILEYGTCINNRKISFSPFGYIIIKL